MELYQYKVQEVVSPVWREEKGNSWIELKEENKGIILPIHNQGLINKIIPISVRR